MAESLSEVGKAAQDMASHALQATVVYTMGGDLSFIITTDKVEVAKELCGIAVKLGAIWAVYKLVKPVIDAVIVKVFGGGERDDQEVRDIRPGSLHVLLRCFTDERFLDVLADYESGRIKESFQKELSLVGIEVEGLKVEIENMKEVEKIKAAINKRKSKPTTASTPSQRNRLPAQSSEDGLRLMDTAGDAKAKVEHGDSDFPKSPPKMEDVQGQMEKHGISGYEEFIKTKLRRWKDVEINIGITGNSGVGKSSFINAIRGFRDDDNGAAKTGIMEEAASVATVYHHPANNKIKFWDLPSIGTPNYATVSVSYSEKVGLEKYDTFLILADVRFTENDLLLAEKVKSMEKSFFLVRTKIDQDVRNERRKETFNEEAMLNDIRKYCLKNLKSFGADDKDVFLISNCYPAKWDFARLTHAILDVLPLHQKESLTLSLNLLTWHSKDILKRKVEILRDRIWMVAAASAAAAAVIPLPGLSIVVDFGLLTHEVNFYKSQLGLPREESNEFLKMTKENQEKILKFCFTNVAQLTKIFTVFAASSAVEEVARFLPLVGSAIAGSISFGSTYYFLRQCLNELEKTALHLLDETNAKVGEDILYN